MATLKLGLIVKAIDQATRPLREVGRAVQHVARQTGLDRVARATARLGRQFGRVGAEAALFARKTGLAAIAAGAATLGLVGRYVRAGDNIAKTADRLGLGIVELQRWRYAAERSGVSAQTFDMAVQRFGRRAAEAAAGTGEAKDALAFLGIQLRDTEGKMRPTEDLMYDVAEALSKIEDPLLRNRVAFKLFDSEGVDVGRMLAQGREKMREYGDEAERLGVHTERGARDSEKFVDALTAMKRSLSFLGHAIGNALMPTLKPAIEDLTEFGVAARPRAMQLARGAAADLAATLRWLREALGDSLERLQGFQRWLRRASPPIAALIDRLRQWAGEFGFVRLAAIAVASALGFRLIRAVLGLFMPLAQLGAAIVAAGVKMLWMAGTAAVKLAGALRGTLAGAFRGAARAARALGRALLANPIVLIGAAIAGAAFLIYRYWDDIAAWFSRQWQAIKAAVPIDAWIASLRDVDLWGTLAGWWQGIAGWFSRQWQAIKAAVPIDAWIASLRDVDLWGTLAGWWQGIAGWFSRQWQAIKAAIDFPGLIASLRKVTLWDVLAAPVRGIVAYYRTIWKGIAAAFDFLGLKKLLDAIGFADIGKKWIDGLWKGIGDAWRGLVAWLQKAVKAVVGWLPAGAAKALGFSKLGKIAVPAMRPVASLARPIAEASLGAAPGAGRRDAALAAPAIFGSGAAAAGAAKQRVEVRVGFDNLPKGARVEKLRADPGVDAEFDAGWAFGA